MNTFEEQVIHKLMQLKQNATAYQIAKELDISKSTIYRVFKDFKINDFQFETVARLVDYGEKLEQERLNGELGMQVLFRYRNERIVLLAEIASQPLLWMKEVTASYIEKPSEFNHDLAQLDIDTQNIEYSLYPFLPMLNSPFKQHSFYTARMEQQFNLENNCLDIVLTVTDITNDTETMMFQEVIYTVEMGNLNIESYQKELSYLGYLIQQYLQVIMQQKVDSTLINYYISKPKIVEKPLYLTKKLEGTNSPIQFDNTLYESMDDVFFELEKLLEGKPYQVSAHEAYMRLHEIKTDLQEFIPSIEVVSDKSSVYLFFKVYSSLGFVVSTQLLATSTYSTDTVSHYTGMAKTFSDAAPAYLSEIEDMEPEYYFQSVQLKHYVL